MNPRCSDGTYEAHKTIDLLSADSQVIVRDRAGRHTERDRSGGGKYGFVYACGFAARRSRSVETRAEYARGFLGWTG